MKDQLSIIGKIAAKSLVSFVSILAFGIVVCSIGLITSLLLLANTKASGGTGAPSTFFTTIAHEYWVTWLFAASLVGFFLYFLLAKTHALQTVLHLFWQHKAAKPVLTRVEGYLQRIGRAQPSSVKSLTEQAWLKVQLLDAVRHDGSIGRVERTVLRFGFEKLRLDDIDFQQQGTGLSQIICQKLESSVSQMTKPSLRKFHLLNVLMALFFVLAIIFDKK